MTSRFQVGDRVHYVYKAHYKNLFGTVLEVRVDGGSLFGQVQYLVRFDTYQGSSLEGHFLAESHLEPETPLEALAFCAKSMP
jgi:hypothetical protein